MNIGIAAERAGLTPKTVRYYEDIGLVRPHRSPNGYRDYEPAHVDRLRFLQRARGLGFSIDECRQLLALYEDKDRASADVKGIGTAKLAEIDHKIADLTRLRDALRQFVSECRGDHRPDCRILEALADERPSPKTRRTGRNSTETRTEPRNGDIS